jgi:hypothetical protein
MLLAGAGGRPGMVLSMLAASVSIVHLIVNIVKNNFFFYN